MYFKKGVLNILCTHMYHSLILRHKMYDKKAKKGNKKIENVCFVSSKETLITTSALQILFWSYRVTDSLTW